MTSNNNPVQVFGVLLYYLTVSQDIQTRLQEDIDDLFENKRGGEDINQDDINDMKYLDQVRKNYLFTNLLLVFNVQVICEGQRLGCLAFTARLCTKSWQVPADNFVIPEGTQVYIPIVGFSRFVICNSSTFNSDRTPLRPPILS